MVYLDGTVWLMSPTFRHERLKSRLNQFVVEVVVGLNIPCISAGSTTFRRRAKKGGVEGDESYYLANEAQIRGKDNIDLRTDPPPDLAIEAVHSHDPEAAIQVYRRLRVPEVWICNEGELIILVLRSNGRVRYTRSSTSAVLPFLSAEEVYGWVLRAWTVPDTEWVKELRGWIRRTLKPRVRKQAGGTG
jgi:Uma2 family endonuclease